MSEPFVEEDVLHNHILYQSERLLCEALLRKDVKGIQSIWPIVKAYRKIVSDEQCKRLYNQNLDK